MAARNDDEPEEIFGFPSEEHMDKILSGGLICNIEDFVDFSVWMDDDLKVEDESDDETPMTNDFESNSGELYKNLWQKMDTVSFTPLIRKLILKKGEGESPGDDSIVTLLYSGYFEGDTLAFMGTNNVTPANFNLSNEGLIPGMDMAIRSMTVGEKAQFLIHYSLMYGELGCPPRIPPKADCLLNILILNVEDIEKSNDTKALGKMPMMSKAYEKSLVLIEEADNNSDHHVALRNYAKAHNLMRECQISNGHEEKIQMKLLSEIYLKQAERYTKINLPKKTCSMCNEYFKITLNINKPDVYLYQGKALRHLSEYHDSILAFNKGLKIDPNNEEIKKELEISESKLAAFNKLTDKMSEMKTDDKSESNKDEIVDQTKAEETVTQEFLEEIERVCYKIRNDESVNEYKYFLPPGLSKSEVDSIVMMAITFDMTAKITTPDVITFVKNED